MKSLLRNFGVILLVAHVCPAFAGQYVKRDLGELGFSEGWGVSGDGNTIVGVKYLDSLGNNQAWYWNAQSGSQPLPTPVGTYSPWAFLSLDNGSIVYDQMTGQVGTSSFTSNVAIFDPVLNTHTVLPNADFGVHPGELNNMSVKHAVGNDLILGYTVFGMPWGPPVRQPTVWRKQNGQWSAQWIQDSSGTEIESLDINGNVYGRSNQGLASIWDQNLVRRDLLMPAGFTGGRAFGRLRDGKILGQVWSGSAWHMAVWNDELSIPTTTFFSSRGQYEPPALGATDLMAMTLAGTSSGLLQDVYTWSPMTGVQELNPQVIGGLPTQRQAVFVGDGGHMIVSTSENFDYRYYLLTPVPEPGSVVALSLGVAASLLRRRRKLHY